LFTLESFLKITKSAQTFGLLFSHYKSYVVGLHFWAIFLQTHLVTLPPRDFKLVSSSQEGHSDIPRAVDTCKDFFLGKNKSFGAKKNH
jgi:hypothetical protein